MWGLSFVTTSLHSKTKQKSLSIDSNQALQITFIGLRHRDKNGPFPASDAYSVPQE